jgi:hypothetical protein
VAVSYDYTDHVKPSEDGLARLSELADEQLSIEQEVAAAEEALKAAQKRLHKISFETIPELMDELKVEEFKTSSGLKVSVKEEVQAKISKANMADALRWLRAHGHEAIIKRKVMLEFGKDEDEQADETLADLRARELQVKDEPSVHASTLKKFVREALADGEEVPQELFGVHRLRIAKVST